MHQYVHLPDRSAATDAAELIARFGIHAASEAAARAAAELIARFGIHAASEAAARADQSRERGNVVLFCRWRQIERMVVVLASGRGAATLH